MWVTGDLPRGRESGGDGAGTRAPLRLCGSDQGGHAPNDLNLPESNDELRGVLVSRDGLSVSTMAMVGAVSATKFRAAIGGLVVLAVALAMAASHIQRD
jgi:hypothetical protein